MDYSILSRSYDLRGIYGVDIDDDFFLRLGYSFSQVTGTKRIALGYDARLSSPALSRAFARGVHLGGSQIVDIGMCSSDMLSFATCFYDDIDSGVMITASHNPKEYNGMKCLAHSGEPYSMKKYGPVLTEIMESFHTNTGFPNENKSLIEKRDILEDWTDHILRFTGNSDALKNYQIVADGGNGVAGVFLPRLQEKIGFEFLPLFLDPDGNFPWHHPNPLLAENREAAKKLLLEKNADVALIFDGDADRVILLDEMGEQVNSAVLSCAIAEKLLATNPHAKFIGNAVTSHNFRDFVQGKGAQYIREMVGHVYIRENMMSDPDILFAGEHSAHYFFRDNYFMDSGIVAAMVFLAMVAESGLSVSDFSRKYNRYISLEETNFDVKDPKGAIAKLTELYKNEKYDLFDGITVEYSDDSWWNFRPSSNEPLLRLNMEARTQERFDELFSEIMEHIRTFAE